MRVTSVTTTDVEDQAGALPGWSQDYRQLAGGRFTGELVHVDVGPVGVFRESTNLRLEQVTAPPPGTLVLGLPLPGSRPARFQGTPLTDGTMLVFSTAAPCEFQCSGAMDIVALAIPTLAFAAAGMALPELVAEGVNGVLASPLAAELRGWVRGLVDHVASAGRDGLIPSPDAVLPALLDVSARTLDAVGPAPERPPLAREGRTRLVARARAYIADHPDEPCTVAQVAGALGVSPRLLEYGFAEEVGMSPNAYLRVVRLNGARRDLRGAEPGSATVADVAMKWGFWHLGRFSAYYRRLFDELPSETLRQR